MYELVRIQDCRHLEHHSQASIAYQILKTKKSTHESAPMQRLRKSMRSSKLDGKKYLKTIMVQYKCSLSLRGLPTVQWSDGTDLSRNQITEAQSRNAETSTPKLRRIIRAGCWLASDVTISKRRVGCSSAPLKDIERCTAEDAANMNEVPETNANAA